MTSGIVTAFQRIDKLRLDFCFLIPHSDAGGDMQRESCEQPSERTASEAGKALATKRKIGKKVAKSLAGTVLSLEKNAHRKAQRKRGSGKRG